MTDEQIITLCRSTSDKDRGFRLLMQAYQERLYWHIRRMVHTHDDTDDVLQNTFIKVYRNIDKYRSESKLYTWLYRIASNESIDHLKRVKRNSSQSLDDETSTAMKLSADPYFDGDQAQLQLVAAIGGLPEKQKAVFNLRYYDEMSYKDMSQVLDTSVGALKASYHHAVKKIEKYLSHGS